MPDNAAATHMTELPSSTQDFHVYRANDTQRRKVDHACGKLLYPRAVWSAHVTSINVA